MSGPIKMKKQKQRSTRETSRKPSVHPLGAGSEPLEPVAEAHPSPPSSKPGTGRAWRAGSGLGPGGRPAGVSLLCSLPKQEVAVFRKCQLIPSCCCQKGKKKKKLSLVSRRLTTTSRKPREHDGCVRSSEYPAEARGPRLSHAVWSRWKGAGRAGALVGAWCCSPRANARLPGRQRLFSLLIPGNNGS